MVKTIKILLGAACVAGVLGWAAAKYNFQEKQRVAAETTRQAIEAERKRFADVYSEAVRGSDEVEIEDIIITAGTTDGEKRMKRFSDPAWTARFAEALAKGTYVRGPLALMIGYPQIRFYRAKEEVLSYEMGYRIDVPLKRMDGGVIRLSRELEAIISELVHEKTR
jgi:hypothetical protein